MCGRFTIQYTWAEYYEALNLIPASAKGRNDPPRYNVCPTQNVGMVCVEKDEIMVKDGGWGLVPFWAKKLEKPVINARSETVDEKPMFKKSFDQRRCLIPASSYYEWERPEPKVALPYNIHLPDNGPFFFAGIWSHHSKLDVTSCAILTAAPHKNISHVHDRMPIILKADQCEQWISTDVGTDEALEIIPENCGADLIDYRVSTKVKTRDTEGSQLIEPI